MLAILLDAYFMIMFGTFIGCLIMEGVSKKGLTWNDVTTFSWAAMTWPVWVLVCVFRLFRRR